MNDFKVIKKFIKLSYQAHKKYYLIVILNAILNSLLTIYNIYSLSYLLNNIISKDFSFSILIGISIVVLNLIFNFFTRLLQKAMDINSSLMKQKINLLISKKIVNMPYHYLEDAQYLDLKEKGKFAIENQDAVNRMLQNISNSITSLIIIISLVAIIVTFEWKILIIIIASVILTIIITICSMSYQFSFYQKLIPINRKFGYFFDILKTPNRQKDYRLSNMGDLMLSRFGKYCDSTISYMDHMLKKMNGFEVLMKLVNYIQMFVVYLIVALKSYRNQLGAGNFLLYINSAIQLANNLVKMLELFIGLKVSSEYLKPLIILMDIEDEKEEMDKIPFSGTIEKIEFKNVSFAYPKSNQLVLKNISFIIEKGEKISIVGLNGAGKTTVIKLICRLFKPTSGEIFVNNHNINHYEYQSYVSEISAVFQDYKLFASTLSENIAINNENIENINECVEKVGLKSKIDTLPDGLSSFYSKAFTEEGIELSGGESQKIAIARALYKKSSLVILDEPTSALDPLAEADIYNNFNSLVIDKTAIYISHRMSSSVFCDKILILNNGEVEDYDTHQNLMSKKESLYYQLFTTQAENYQI